MFLEIINKERERTITNYKNYYYFNKLRHLRAFALFAFIFMALFQKPAWCESEKYSVNYSIIYIIY